MLRNIPIIGDYLVLFCRDLEDAERKYVQKVAFWSLIGHLVAAYFSTGFHHWDEHFQIVEFLSYKLGITDAESLAWEFHHRIRPWAQIFFYYTIAKPLHVFGASPFSVVFLLRLITSLIGWFALLALTPVVKSTIENLKWRKRTYLLTHFFWFIPYFQVRTGSENLSASLFVLGFASFYWAPKIKQSLASGILLGLSYTVRFQAAFSVAFLWFQELIFGGKAPEENPKRKRHGETLIYSAIGVVLAIGFGSLIDFWGYGNFEFPAWNYFYQNIILDKAARWGIEPWYFYFTKGLKEGVIPVSPIIIFGMLGFWALYPKSKLTWATLPFFVAHCLVGHKELRFIFPILLFAPLMLGKVLEQLEQRTSPRKWLDLSWKIFLTINFVLYAQTLFRSANSSVDFYQFIYEQNIEKLYIDEKKPFELAELPVHYYKPSQYSSLPYQEIPTEGKFYIFIRQGRRVLELREKSFCQLKYVTYPSWMLNFNVTGWISRSQIWSIFHCSDREKTLNVVSE